MKRLYQAKAFLFDFDGTLVDSMPFWAEAMLNVLNRHGISYPYNVIKIITPLGIPGTAAYFRALGLDLSVPEIIEEINGELVPMYRDRVLAKPHVKECLEALKKDGRILAVLTASPHLWLDSCLKKNGLFDLFEAVWSSDDFGTDKTDPNVYAEAAKRLGVTVADVTFLDDNLFADRAAMKSGCGVIGVYDETGKEAEADIRASTDGYIYDFGELQKAVLGK